MPTEQTEPENLYTCPFCEQPNFTEKGLRSHRCRKITGIPPGKKSRALTKDEYRYIIAFYAAERLKIYANRLAALGM